MIYNMVYYCLCRNLYNYDYTMYHVETYQTPNIMILSSPKNTNELQVY